MKKKEINNNYIYIYTIIMYLYILKLYTDIEFLNLILHFY